MKLKTIVLSMLLTLIGGSISALPIDAETACKSAKSYLSLNNEECGTLTLKQTLQSTSGITSIYVFNIDNRGFILVTADDELDPILGYSFSDFDAAMTNPAFREWMFCYQEDIAAVITERAETGKSTAEILNPEQVRNAVAEWTAIKNGDESFYNTKSAKNVEKLVTTNWDQGAGYNNYCPTNSNGQHVVVGCVATAMAQVIHYHKYPRTGFGKHSYNAPSYGRQTAVFDTAVYNHTIMPQRVTSSSAASQQHAVSLLCYHCGVAVEMTYQYAGHTEGSGAYVQDVPEALMHFGYFDSYMLYKSTFAESVWCDTLRHELDCGRPMVYQGHSSSGGHAFVCDGYRTGNKFHFNWGWSGSGDGYFTLTTMKGFTNTQGAVFNITPSKLAANTSTYYISSNGTGNGTSWDSPNCNLAAAIQARGIYGSGQVWIKEGTYYGDTIGSTAFVVSSGVKVYGGFEGNETSLSQRNPDLHPTILDGQKKRAIATCGGLRAATGWHNLIFENGKSSDVAAIKVMGNMTLQSCIFRNNIATNNGTIVTMTGGNMKKCTLEKNKAATGATLRITGGLMQTSHIVNNLCDKAVRSSGGSVSSCLIAHNSNNATDATAGGQYVNCTMVANGGNGGSYGSGAQLINCIIWNNTSAPEFNGARVTFSAVEGTAPSGNGNIALNSENAAADGPNFVRCGRTRGTYSSNNDDWHITSVSPCVNAGDTNSGVTNGNDLDGGIRIHQNRVDMGCYEYGHADINPTTASLELSLYPNPTTGYLTVTMGDNAGQNVALYDMRGRKVLDAGRCESTTTLNLSALPQGCYILRCGGNVAKVVKK